METKYDTNLTWRRSRHWKEESIWDNHVTIVQNEKVFVVKWKQNMTQTLLGGGLGIGRKNLWSTSSDLANPINALESNVWARLLN